MIFITINLTLMQHKAKYQYFSTKVYGPSPHRNTHRSIPKNISNPGMVFPKRESIIDFITSGQRKATKCDKDFVKSNIIENRRSVPRKPPPSTYVDTRKGDRQLLKPPGLLPVYSRKKDYGETPEYLKQRKEGWRAQQQQHERHEHANPDATKQQDTRRGERDLHDPPGPKYIKKKDYGETPDYLLQRNQEWRDQKDYDDYVQDVLNREAMRGLSEAEEQIIVESLRENFDEQLQQYQSLPFNIDTPSKKRRKDCLESAMKQLENLINVVESRPVYVSNPLVMKPDPKTIGDPKHCRETRYLQEYKAQINRQQENYDNYVRERIMQEDMELLPDVHKQLILGSLKKNCERLHERCQGLSAPGAKYNMEALHDQYKGFAGVKPNVPTGDPKEHLESMMKHTENVIKILVRKNIYIANT